MTPLKVRKNISQLQKKTELDTAQQKASNLLIVAQTACDNLFLSGDFSLFLTLLSHFPYHHIYNLLLLSEQYPNATCLASYYFWKETLGDQNLPVLKPIWAGKGIDLIVPFTCGVNGTDCALNWGAIKQYDLEQTNLQAYDPPTGGYLLDDNHLSILLDSITDVLALDHYYSVVSLTPTEEHRITNIPGVVTDNIIQVREDLSPAQQLAWLGELLCSFVFQEDDTFSVPQQNYARKYALYCLSLMWGLQKEIPFPKKRGILKSVEPSVRLAFLKKIQQIVRTINNAVLTHYNEYRESTEELDDLAPFS